MITCRRFALVIAVGALSVAVPAAARRRPTGAPEPPGRRIRPSTSHKCTPHNQAYTASGLLVSWAATQTAGGTSSGTITVHATRTNHHAAKAKGTDVTYTLTSAKVTFGKGVNPPTAGDRTKVIGKDECARQEMRPDRLHADDQPSEGRRQEREAITARGVNRPLPQRSERRVNPRHIHSPRED